MWEMGWSRDLVPLSSPTSPLYTAHPTTRLHYVITHKTPNGQFILVILPSHYDYIRLVTFLRFRPVVFCVVVLPDNHSVLNDDDDDDDDDDDNNNNNNNTSTKN